MPTGYTADIKDGISFETYALNCARAFGACVTLRDEPGGGERIPDSFEPSDYHAKAAEAARAELAVLDAMTPEECARAASKDYDDTETSRVMRLKHNEDRRSAYEAMLAQVNAWTPPTPDHVEYHKFMREQIEQSIDADCNSSYDRTPTKRVTGEQWAATRREELVRNIEYHGQEHAQEVRRAEQRTAWIQALKGSLK